MLLAGAAEAASTQADVRKVRSILLVWLGGGPSHLDLFDPKPKAPAEYRGPFATIATRTPGVRFTELLPQAGGAIDKFSLIRSNVNFDDGHREAGSIALTGADAAATEVYPPNFGSIVARQRGHDATCRGSSRWPAARSATASARFRATAAGPGARATIRS